MRLLSLVLISALTISAQASAGFVQTFLHIPDPTVAEDGSIAGTLFITATFNPVPIGSIGLSQTSSFIGSINSGDGLPLTPINIPNSSLDFAAIPFAFTYESAGSYVLFFSFAGTLSQSYIANVPADPQGEGAHQENRFFQEVLSRGGSASITVLAPHRARAINLGDDGPRFPGHRLHELPSSQSERRIGSLILSTVRSAPLERPIRCRKDQRAIPLPGQGQPGRVRRRHEVRDRARLAGDATRAAPSCASRQLEPNCSPTSSSGTGSPWFPGIHSDRGNP